MPSLRHMLKYAEYPQSFLPRIFSRCRETCYLQIYQLKKKIKKLQILLKFFYCLFTEYTTSAKHRFIMEIEQPFYILRNIEAYWFNHCCSGKAISITQLECVCICSVSYPACNAQAPYYHLCPAPLYNIFPHYLINGTIFEKKLLNTKCVLWFSLQHLSETFLILRINERHMAKNVYWSSCKVPVILVRL